MQFFIFQVNGGSGTLLYQSSIKSFVDDGFSYKFSDPLSFTFLPGTTYSIGGVAGVGASYRVDPAADTVGAFSFRTTNGNLSGSTFTCCGGADIDTALVLANGAAPEPGTWALMILGFGVVGGALRGRRRPDARRHAVPIAAC